MAGKQSHEDRAREIAGQEVRRFARELLLILEELPVDVPVTYAVLHSAIARYEIKRYTDAP